MMEPIPTALSASRFLLRLLIILNWIYGAAILVGLIASFTAEEWLFTALGITPSPETKPLIQGMRGIAFFGLVSIPLHYLVLSRLLDMVERIRGRDPFFGPNSYRLQTIAWALLGLQLLSLVIGAIARVVSTPSHPLYLDAGFSTGGWLAVFLLFVLARVFAEGARMRDELEGTV